MKIFNSQKGVGLMDIIIGTALMLIVFLGIFGAYQLGMKAVGQSKNKITATSIATQQLEKIRNLPYLSIGTKEAVLPYAQGILDSATSTSLNNIDYYVITAVKYISDSADGTGINDSCDLDYKRAEVRVGWSGRFGGEVKLVSDFAPKNKVEEVSSCQAQPGGILSVLVFDAFGVMVFSPLIEIFDSNSGSLVDSATPSSGEYDFPLATSTSKVVISKSGYSSQRTYGIDEIAIPEKPHPMVLEGEITEISFSIDKTSLLSVDTQSQLGPVPQVVFHLRGEKIIGLDQDEEPVYKYSQNHTSDLAGHIDIAGLEWDSYIFSINPDSGLDLASTTPSQPVDLAPDTTLPVILHLVAENSLWLAVQDIETSEPVFAATTTLFSVGYNQTKFTDEEGETYFLPLEESSYNLDVAAPGYLATSTSFWVSGDVIEIVKLRRIE